MKLKAKPYGQRRTVVKFAWLPVYVERLNRVWLERYLEEQAFGAYAIGYGEYRTGWHCVERRSL